MCVYVRVCARVRMNDKLYEECYDKTNVLSISLAIAFPTSCALFCPNEDYRIISIAPYLFIECEQLQTQQLNFGLRTESWGGNLFNHIYLPVVRGTYIK